MSDAPRFGNMVPPAVCDPCRAIMTPLRIHMGGSPLELVQQLDGAFALCDVEGRPAILFEGVTSLLVTESPDLRTARENAAREWRRDWAERAVAKLGLPVRPPAPGGDDA